jgi:hypothetical protein
MKRADSTWPCRWTGVVTELMPPNYGIVDGCAFYHIDVVQGPRPNAVGEQVDCEAIANLDGGKYEWRLVKVSLARPRGPRVCSSRNILLRTSDTHPWQVLVMTCSPRARRRPVKTAAYPKASARLHAGHASRATDAPVAGALACGTCAHSRSAAWA